MINPKEKSKIYSKATDKFHAADFERKIKILESNGDQELVKVFRRDLEVMQATEDAIMNRLSDIKEVVDTKK